ncbi:hypothetical protein [Macrococcoides canis]|uniref:Uncharacterized protein n=1 Tax=Macrococcoides canis TaxID=1855823 RepID=A0A4R6C281_9STAP|nr:hypothetical protein [Macrococcus]TDM15155.1 hypothetical protein ETI04_10625 [Macrococcus canis]TDM29274.1 hypothetical protein ETI03_10655 [Macrococcus canis]TDM31971.1 hypothetical protein ETI13_10605 [Macrococcus canis]TDM38966.1 hypothetical protein ETI10_12880 [Macrococcus goetzii]TDM39943.1 hypothetical protein ETI09_10660 [Macrococcus canis]
MKKKRAKILLLSVMICNLSLTSVTHANTEPSIQSFNAVTVNPEGNTIKVVDNGVFINGKFYTPEEFDKLLKSAEITYETPSNNTHIQTRAAFALAPAVYVVPGIGQVALLTTGAIVVGGVTIASGTWLYNKISSHFSDPRTVISNTYGISSGILDSNGKVKLGEFKDKNGNTPKTKSSGSFKHTKKKEYTVDKDTANHGGRKWKLKKNGKRVASLDGNGKVLSK